MSTRELLKEDLDSLIALYKHLHDSDHPLPHRQQVKSVWNEVLGDKKIKYWGYFLDGRLVSSCAITIIPNLTRGCSPYAVVENVVTHHQFRKCGYGQAVLQTALDFAWHMNCYKVMLMTARIDDGVFSFYESVGFRRDKKQAFVLYKNDL